VAIVLPGDKAMVTLHYMKDEEVVRCRMTNERAHREMCGRMQVSTVAKQQAIRSGLAWSIAESEALIELCRQGRRKHDFLKFHLRKGDPIHFLCDKYIAASWYGVVAEDNIQ
jgi:hypothetical protein